MSQSHLPKWLRDLQQLLPIRSQFVLTGSIRDKVLLGTPNGDALVSLRDALWRVLEADGYAGLLVWDMVDGLRAHPPEPSRQAMIGGVAGVDLGKPQPMALSTLAPVLRRVNAPSTPQTPPVALLLDFASRLRGETGMDDEARRFFVAAEKAALEARPVPRAGTHGNTGLFNPVVWLANRPGDLPHWLTVDNERVRHVALPAPNLDTRLRAARCLYARMQSKDCTAEEFSEELAGLTDNMSLTALEDIVSLANRMGRSAKDVDEAVRSHRVGDLAEQSPWRGSQLRQNIVRAELEPAPGEDDLRISQRVLGQPAAVRKVMDILKRTSIGLTGAHTRSSAGRPRGVLFFVGPTGVGKTETAKAIAKVVFGDEGAMKRFDMSEFSAEHAGDRLIGAPPGYVGFDQGGELTNAMRERPFRVLLFDEVEKAHHRILDKFLQVLEDGRLTDGRGETVHFSESLLVFTSNLGVSRRLEDGAVEMLVSPDDPPGEFEAHLIKGVEDHFRTVLQRPELLNRIGQNVVVFHFITPEVGLMILDGMLRNVFARVREEHGVTLELSDQARRQLGDLCVGSRVDNGGRGIGSKLEDVFVNPLARHLFDRMTTGGLPPGDRLRVTGLRQTETGYELQAS